MPELLAALTKEVELSPRRGVLRTLATMGVGVLVGGRGAPSAEAKRKGKKGNKNKGKDRCKQCPSCDACPNCDECASTCTVVLTGPGGEKICADGFSFPDCTPCTSHGECDPVFPYSYCVSEEEVLETGEKKAWGCKGSPSGMCVLARACAAFS